MHTKLKIVRLCFFNLSVRWRRLVMRSVRKICKELYSVDGSDGVWWLGNAGFAIRLGNHYVFIDPVVTKKAVTQIEKTQNRKVLHDFPLEADEFKQADHVLYTHEHNDHMDPGLFPKLTELKSSIWGPEHSKKSVLGSNVPKEQFHVAKVGQTIIGENYKVEVVRSRHGCVGNQLDSYPEVQEKDKCSCGYLVKTQYGNIYHPGDTYYLEESKQLNVTYLLLPISENNLGTGLGAKLTYELQPKIVIPCHYGMFDPPQDWQGGDPIEYLAALKTRKYSIPYTNIVILNPGGSIFLK
jgi:L-ascorbate metabolism protein UlaG (beta-lactamase superfamily)